MGRNPGVREDPRVRFPWARSVLAVSQRYRHPVPEGTPRDRLIHAVARYARGADYHDVLGSRLRHFREWIQRELAPDLRAVCAVDTGPYLEREYYVSAGLGWIGKNTLALSRKDGSWFVIGIMFTSLDLPMPLHVEPDHCGSCTRCLDACPTSAFPQPYRLDARLCLSYQTIEHKGLIDPHGTSWAFGCDICQEVCPWNRKSPWSDNEEYAPSPDLLSLSSDAILGMEQEEFRRRFRRSPLWRPKLDGLRRNLRASVRERGPIPGEP